MSKLDQLRATMDSLESYQLPDKFSLDNVDQVLDQELIDRYQAARDEYIHRRMLQVFYDHVGTLDENGDFDLPPLPTQEEQDELAEKRAAVQQELLQTAAKVNQSNLELQAKYSALVARRQELANMIHDIEQKPMSQDDDEDDSIMEADDDDDVDAFTYEGQHMADVTQRKVELEVELQRIRQEKALAYTLLEERKKEVQEILKARGDHVAAARTVSPETVEALQSDTNRIREKVQELKSMSEWYSGICGVMEEISGIKLLSVENGAQDEEENAVVVKVQLLDKHKINITMASRGCAFHVTGASFETSTLVKSTQDSVQLNIPALDDLVRLSVNLGSVEDLRFLLRETIARIRTITARVDELAILRTRYLSKIGKIHQNSFGGEDQEIVCSLNEGITAVLRLSPDCPMVDGSVLLDQIVGVGGWDMQVLEIIKDSVNEQNCKGPLAIMEALVKEIGRLENQGVSLPRTPSMPSRKADD